ncbi:MAG: hypothetical protein ACR2QT_06630 [Woeseiaceae bacterium]
MQCQGVNWLEWKTFFKRRADRSVPAAHEGHDHVSLPASLARSLAIFQLGESGGGTIIEQARASGIAEIDDDYADAMALFVAEENRHADILANCVAAQGGELIQENWTARLFVGARRLIGLRLKVIVLLAAEVVGICYYHLLSQQMPGCRTKSLLAELVRDETSHLYFHCQFLRTQTKSWWRQLLFKIVWRLTMLAAAIAVMIDHRTAIRDMSLGYSSVWQRWMSYSRLAEQLVVDSSIDEIEFETVRY